MISLFTRPFAAPLAQAVRECRQHLVQAATFSALLNLLYLAPSLYLLSVYDRVVPTRAVQTLAMLTAIYVFAIVTLGALDWLRSSLLIRSAARLDRLLAGDILAALLASTEPSTRQSGTVLRDFDTFRQTMTGPSVIAFFDVPWSPIYILVCFILHPLIGVFALACSAILVGIAIVNERSVAPSLAQALVAQQRAYQSIEATLRASGVVRALGMEQGLIARHLRERAEATATQAQTAFVSARLVTITKVARIAMQSFALGLGALLAIEQQISAGAIFAAALLVSRALAPLEGITAAWRNTVQIRVAIDSLNAVFEHQAAGRSATLLPAPIGRIELARLSVTLPDREEAVLRDISARIEPGEMIGIIGPSGAGKSTLLRTMAGELAPQSGQIRLDGAALGDWRPEQRAAAVGYLPQSPSLLHGTIKDNIARFRTETATNQTAIDRAVVEVARLCDAHEFILRLPMAYETVVQAGGGGLSIGQAQRIALARALFGKPAVLLLDEPNAHLDAEGEGQLIATLARLKRDKVTIVIVAHRMPILEGSDKLLVLRAGKLEGFGPSQDIIRRFATPRPGSVVERQETAAP